MAKNKLKIKENLKLGFKISLVGILPSLIVTPLFYIPNLSMDAPGLKEFIIGASALLLIFYFTGFFINKWKKWIFK